MAAVAKRPKKDMYGYYIDTAQGKFRIDKRSFGWVIYNCYNTRVQGDFRTLTDAVTYIEEGWHVL